MDRFSALICAALLAAAAPVAPARAQEAAPAPPALPEPGAAPAAPGELAPPAEAVPPLGAAPAPAPAAEPAGPSSPSPVIAAIGRADMMAIMQQAGMTNVSDGTRDEATPWVVGSAPGGIFVEADFFNCEPGVTGPQRQCSQFRFRVHWTNAKHLDAKAVDAYNERYVFGRALASSDGKFIETTAAFNLDGGVTRDYIAKNLNYFLITVDDFINYVKP